LHWIESTDPTAPQALAKVLRALDGGITSKPIELWRSINPFRGLSALEEQDADFFFGRDATLVQILHTILAAKQSIITLVGNSGVGKTSLIQAGVIASLKRACWPRSIESWPQSLKDSRTWVYLTMRPNDSPIRALASAFVNLWFEDPTDPKRFA